ncbi:MAG: hypothetical protein R3F37_04690 [Candidatus Competibacteraceae bacterium]
MGRQQPSAHKNPRWWRPLRSETQALEKSKPEKRQWLFVVMFLIVVLLGGAGVFTVAAAKPNASPAVR